MTYVRDLRESDLSALANGTGAPAQQTRKLRDRHHALARLLAQGMTNTEASLVTGYDISYISVLKADPAVKQLIADYQKIDAGLQAEFMDRAAILTMTAMGNLQDLLEDDDNPASLQANLEIFKAGADRIGYGPQTKSTQVNVNVELGSRLAAARARLDRAVSPVIEGEVVGPRSRTS